MSVDCCSCPFTDTAFVGASCGASFALFMGLVEFIVSNQCNIVDPCNRAGRDDFEVGDFDTYDFIVVGAGPAGSVVTSRLAENPLDTVLLLEAGREEPSATQIPAFAMTAIDSDVDWRYNTEPQSRACLSRGGVCGWPRGKMISGTSGMQGMMYNRGNAEIYNNMAAAGNTGWGYDDVLPYFIKAENNQNPEIVDEGYHGFEGPLTVGRFPHHPLLSETILEAAAQMGYKRGDLNGRNQTGFDIAQMMVSDGLRASTSRMYLREAAKGGNLNVSINSHVTRILIDAEGKATGVQFVDGNGVNKTVLARKEVILSAGTIGSPQLLLLSGIGPRADLEELGINVVQDLPVGKNLHNHASAAVEFNTNDTSYQTLTVETLNEYLQFRTGPMASTGLTQTSGFMLSKYAEDGIPDLQVFFDGFSAQCTRTGLDTECTDGNIEETCGQRRINARPTMVFPRSRGTLKLKTANPFDYPALDPNYFDQSVDLDILVDGLKKMIEFSQTEALQRWGFTLITDVTQGCEAHEFGSDDYWKCHVGIYTGAENHEAGTCRMGPVGDPEAVVDPELRVHGIPNLRVVDASIFPLIPNSNPTAGIIMAAEKCADLIKSTWAFKKQT